MFSALRENYESLSWDSDKKQTAQAYFDESWRSSIKNLSNSAQSRCSHEIREKESQLAQFQQLQALLIQIQNQGATMRDLCFVNADLANLFRHAEKSLLLYLDHPPMLFLVLRISLTRVQYLFFNLRAGFKQKFQCFENL